MKGPELKIEFCAYYNDKKEKFDEGGVYPFLEYCQQSKPKDVIVRIDYEMGFDEIDVYCESLGISNLSYEKVDDSKFIARFICDSKSGKPMMRVLYGLGKAGNGGHTYEFTVGKEKFYFDGDGVDRVMKINGVKFHSIKTAYDLGKAWNDTTKKDNEENSENNMAVDINEAHGQKKHNGPKNAMAAMRKGNREADQEMYGGGFRQTKKVHKAKNDYDRKGNKIDVNNIDKFREDESVNKISANDIRYMVSECLKKIVKEGALDQYEDDNYLGVPGANRTFDSDENYITISFPSGSGLKHQIVKMYMDEKMSELGYEYSDTGASGDKIMLTYKKIGL